MKIVLINKYFEPDNSATSQLATDLVNSLASAGHQVRVITSRQLYTNPKAALGSRIRADGVIIERLRATAFGRSSVIGRICDSLSYLLHVFFHLLFTLKRNHIVICCTDPPLVCVPVAWACRLKGAALVNWLQDVYPEVPARLGVLSENGIIFRLLRSLRNSAVSKAALNVVIGNSMAGVLHTEVKQAKVAIIPNWCDDEVIRPLSHEQNPLRTEWGLENCFVVGYSGNFGRAHEAQTLLSVAEELKSRSDIRFLLIGEGSQHAMLRGEAEQRGLQNIMFRPYQPREMLGLSLTAIDLHLVSLRPELEGLIVPSKFYGIAAAARPMVYIGSENGEIAGKISRWQCGWVISPGNAPELAQLIVDLAENDSQCQETGLAARQAVNEQYSKTVSLAAWREQLEAVNTGIYPINR